jgi:hypothetical protein
VSDIDSLKALDPTADERSGHGLTRLGARHHQFIFDCRSSRLLLQRRTFFSVLDPIGSNRWRLPVFSVGHIDHPAKPITDALNLLRKQGMISYQRGQITIHDRKGMEGIAGEAYGTPESEYRRLIG